MNTQTQFRSKALAVGSALLISTLWMAGIAALAKMENAQAHGATPLVIGATPILLDEAAARQNTIVVTARRLAPAAVAHMKTINVTTRREKLAAIYIPPADTASVVPV